jgi:hypothetical protein
MVLDVMDEHRRRDTAFAQGIAPQLLFRNPAPVSHRSGTMSVRP